jgi:hypothetical protein
LPKEASKQSQSIGKALAKEDKPIALNSTQAVVVALANLLPEAIYHVFMDNIFSSSNLRSLPNNGHGAKVTSRKHSDIDEELARDKGNDGKARNSYKFNQVKVILIPDVTFDEGF